MSSGDVGLDSDIWATESTVSAQRLASSEFMARDKEEVRLNTVVYCDSSADKQMLRLSHVFFRDLDGDDDYNSSIDRETIKTKTYVFVSKDASYLDKLFNKVTPERNELVLFLEDNQGDLLSDVSAHVKLGNGFNYAGRRETLADSLEESERIQELDSQLDEFNLGLSAHQIATLIREGELKSVTMRVVDFIMQLSNLGDVLLADAFELIGNGLLKGTELIRNYVKFQNHHWDPNAEWNEEEKGEKPTFSPVLFSLQDSAIDVLEEINSEVLDDLENKMRELISGKSSKLKTNLNELATNTVLHDKVPDGFVYVMEYLIDGVSKIETAILEAIVSIPSLFAQVGKKVLAAINAFYCGLWNSLVEAILGLVDLVGYLFLLGAAKGHFFRDYSGNTSKIREMIDEAIQAVINFNYSTFLSGIISTVRAFNFPSISGIISIEKVCYGLGAITGFIIEILVDIFISGGTKAIVSVGNKLGNWGKRIFEIIKRVLTQSIGKTGKEAGTAIFRSIMAVINFIKSGATKVLEGIKMIFREIGLLAKYTRDQIDDILRKIGMTSDQYDVLEDGGYLLRNFDEVLGKCSFCKIPV